VPEEEKGKYTVGDVTYLEGKVRVTWFLLPALASDSRLDVPALLNDTLLWTPQHHEKRLVTGVSCEVWLEAEDRWIPGACGVRAQAAHAVCVPVSNQP
jgi:hypothetical protein